MSQEIVNSKPGTALIQAKFLLTDHVRELNINFVANKDKTNVNKRTAGDSTEPPKKKLKGQNKHRPREKKTPKSEKLCFSIGNESSCSYGDKCSYSHNVEAYLSAKPDDIGDVCYLFKTFGKCLYSFSCRFAKKHILNGKNVVNMDLWNSYKDKRLTVNHLGKDLQKLLRRREYDFSLSQKACLNIDSKFKVYGVKPEQNKILDESTKSDDGTCCESTNFPVSSETAIIESNINNNDIIISLVNASDVQSELVDSVVPSEIKPDNKAISLPLCNENDITSTAEVLTDAVEDVSAGVNTLDNNGDSYNGEINPIDFIKIDTSTSTGVDDLFKLKSSEVKKIDFRGKLFLAPLTTVGNLPFRRICKEFGVDITCSEMAMAISLLQGQQSEWALLKRHHTEDIFGVQLCGAHADLMTKCSQLLTESISLDFIDINMGCPLDLVYKKGAGCGLMNRLKKFDGIVAGMSSVMNIPLTVKMRAGVYAHEKLAHNVIKRINQWDDRVSLITLHGRSREQRYTRLADWSYIDRCAEVAHPIPLFGSGDVLSFEDYNQRLNNTKASGAMIARGALIKPWIFKEIKEQRHWDISSSERLDILRSYSNYGLEHWGSDTEGVEKTRRFLLEWLSFLYRYIPVGILEHVPQQINERPPPYFCRNDLETLMASPSCGDWIKISEMLLGPVPTDFVFLPKHKANAYQ